MARPGVGFEDISAAADALLDGGERPTTERIRGHLGRGSPNTIGPLLDRWWATLGPRLRQQQAKLALPEAPQAVVGLASQFWEQALLAARTEAERALAEDKIALAASRTEAEARIAAAERRAEAAATRAAEAAGALQGAHDRLEDRQRLIEQQAAQIADLLATREAQAARERMLDADANTLRDRLVRLQADAEAAREAQSAHLRAVEDRASQEIDRARQEARERTRELLRLEKSRGQQVRALEVELAQVRADHSAASLELAAEHARRQTLEQQLAELHVRFAKALETPARRKVAVRSAGRAKQGKASDASGARRD